MQLVAVDPDLDHGEQLCADRADAGYELESMRLVPASDLQEFEAAEPESLGAVGEEAVSAFDFDISL
jgi:hypothetical protein